MKKILNILTVTGIVFFISSRAAAQTVDKLPIRTADPHPAVQRAIPVALPIKSGGGEKTITSVHPGAVKAIVPPIRSGSTTSPGSIKPTPAGAASTKLPIKGTGTGATIKQ
jgi:hypothetical protein